MDKKYRPFIIGLGAVILIAVLYLIFKPSTAKASTVTPKEPAESSNLLNVLTELFGKGQGREYFCRIFPKSCAEPYCDCTSPGFTRDGVRDPLCNEEGLQFEKDCR